MDGTSSKRATAMHRRVSGVTIPLFSIRTRQDWGIGQISDLPSCAAWFSRAGQRLVQVLPTHELADGETSPYGALSAFALDPIYIAVDRVRDLDESSIAAILGTDGAAELERVRRLPRVDYQAVRRLKRRVLSAGFDRFREGELAKGSPRAKALLAFVDREAAWLRDYALYAALRAQHDNYGWTTWPEVERDRHPEILALAASPRDDGALGTRVLEQMYLQWIAHEQWDAAKAELSALGIALMGDLPFIVGSESADLWAHQDQFRTDVSLGAPPDDFAPEGQSWGLPAYDWAAMEKNDLAWLRARAAHAARLFDRFRIDHVVGFFRQWLRKDDAPGAFVPSTEPEQRARGERVLRAMIEAAGSSGLIAEDLGVIPPFVRETMKQLGLPGYKVLPWERDKDFQPYDPRQFPELSVATWSTHDTAPITQWWFELEGWERERLARLGGLPQNLDDESRELGLFKLLLSSRSSLTLFLAPELLGDRTRINTPATISDQNWTWRFSRPIEELAVDERLGKRFDAIQALVGATGRL